MVEALEVSPTLENSVEVVPVDIANGLILRVVVPDFPVSLDPLIVVVAEVVKELVAVTS